MDSCWIGPQTKGYLREFVLYFLQVGFFEINENNTPNIVLCLADGYIVETSMFGWEDVPLGFAGLFFPSSQQKKMQRKQLSEMG